MTPIYVVDSFTQTSFSGNPAGVCLLDQPKPEQWMRDIAAEMKHSETCFLVKENTHYSIRYFTPTSEVPLCGHATLAVAHVLWEEGLEDKQNPLVFNCQKGRLEVHFKDNKIQMNFPQIHIKEDTTPTTMLLDALGISDGIVATKTNGADLLIELRSEETLKALNPDVSRPLVFPSHVVIVTAKSTGKYDFVSRVFAPNVGIPEDPVTGAAHCALGPYWAEKLNQSHLKAYQASARGGEMDIKVESDRVLLSGEAVMILKGSLHA